MSISSPWVKDTCLDQLLGALVKLVFLGPFVIKQQTHAVERSATGVLKLGVLPTFVSRQFGVRTAIFTVIDPMTPALEIQVAQMLTQAVQPLSAG
jgi:hypothetical protein